MQRREDILDAAFEVFSRLGYLNASATEVARRAGFTLPGLSHHFPTKAALFEAVVSRRDMDAQEHLVDRRGLDFLRGLVEVARRDETDRRATRLFSIISAEATDPEHPMHDYMQARYDLILTSVTEAMRAIRADGGLRDGLDPAEAAKRYVALADGLQVQSLYNEQRTTQTFTLRAALQEMLTIPL